MSRISSTRGVCTPPPLPGLAAATIDAFVARRFEMGETALIREFRAAVATG